MQHLNFYTQLERVEEPLFSARQQLQLVVVLFAIMLLVTIGLTISENSLSSQLEAAQAEEQGLANEVELLNAERTRQQNNPELDNALASLQREVSFRQRMLENITPDDNTAERGFARHFGSLARQHIDGMWFTEIQLRAGGNELALVGKTQQPEFVPRYLQKLSGEGVFEGHHFRVLRMHTPTDSNGVLDFELRAKEVDQP